MSAFVDPSTTPLAEEAFRGMITEDFVHQSTEARWWDEFMVWHGPAGIGTAQSRPLYVQHFLTPLYAAFSQAQVELEYIVCEGAYCGAQFTITGNHSGVWLG